MNLRTHTMCAGVLLGLCALAGGVSAADTSTPKFTWTIRGTPHNAIEPGQALPVTIVVGQVSASGVHVTQSTLVDKSTFQSLAPAGLTLCQGTEAPCPGTSLALPANTSHQLWLLGSSAIGQFDGNVTVSAAEKPEGDNIQMTVYVSTLCRKSWGIAVLALGVVLAWFGTVFVRNAITRDQMLQVVRAGLGTLTKLDESLENKEPAAPGVKAKCLEVLGALTEPLLQAHGLPPRTPLVGGASAATLADFKVYVQTQLDWIAAIGVVVREGLQAAWDVEASGNGLARVLPPAQAVDKLTRLLEVPSPPTLDRLRADVAVIVADLARLNPSLTKEASEAKDLTPAEPTMQTLAQLQTDIGRLSAFGWAFTLLVTVITGSYILVFGPGSAGFGTAVDYLKCILWGLGLPAGAQLMQATTASISTTLGVPR